MLFFLQMYNKITYAYMASKINLYNFLIKMLKLYIFFISFVIEEKKTYF